MRLFKQNEQIDLHPILKQRETWKSHFMYIMIDGVKLNDIMKEVEMPMTEAEGHPSIAGGYGAAEFGVNCEFLTVEDRILNYHPDVSIALSSLVCCEQS